MLLTAGQVSAVISSSIIFIFTFLLFLTGYTLQQQTVAALSAGIKPRVQYLASQVRKPEPPPVALASEVDEQPRIKIQGAGRTRFAGDRGDDDTEMRWVKVGDAWRLVSVGDSVNEEYEDGAAATVAAAIADDEVVSLDTLKRLNGGQGIRAGGSRLWKRDLGDWESNNRDGDQAAV